jgi:hypothetical protein
MGKCGQYGYPARDSAAPSNKKGNTMIIEYYGPVSSDDAAVDGSSCSDLCRQLDGMFQDWDYDHEPVRVDPIALRRGLEIAQFLQDVFERALSLEAKRAESK